MRFALASVILTIFFSWIIRRLSQYQDVEFMSTSSIIFGSILAHILRPFDYLFCYNGEHAWHGTYKIQGISAPVIIRRDVVGVPYVEAESVEDMFFAQGYIHARERPWQMGLIRLVFNGELSKLIGDKGLKSDRLMLGLGIRRGAEEGLNAVPSNDSDLRLMTIYTKGITEGFRSLEVLPLEFKLLRHTLNTTWTVVDTVSMMRLMAMAMNRGWTIEVGERILSRQLSKALKQAFDMIPDPATPPINPYGLHASLFNQNRDRLSQLRVLLEHPAQTPPTEWASTRPSMLNTTLSSYVPNDNLDTEDDSDDTIPSFSGIGSGSNAWVVSGNYTQSGKPIVAGDPHLSLNVPGFWFPMSLSAPSIHAVGVSIAGFPGVLIGHTTYTAWSITLNYFDLEDLFILQTTKNGTHYIYDGEEYPLEILTRPIQVKNRPEDWIAVLRWSHHGPIISDLLPKLSTLVNDDQAIAIASPALRAPLPIKWPRQMLNAKGWRDILEGTDEMGTSGFSVTWATYDNDIGVFLSGSFPNRTSSSTMRDGSSSVNDWNSVLPSSHLPHIMNPPNQGFVFSANQRVAHDHNSVFGKSAMSGSRAWRINQLLEEKIFQAEKTGMKITVDDMRLMQMDLFAYPEYQWRLLIKTIIERHGEASKWCQYKNPELLKTIIQSIIEWDSMMSSNSIAASVVEVWMQFTLQELIQNQEALEVLLGKSLHPLIGSHQEYQNHWKLSLIKLLKDQKIHGTSFDEVSNGREPIQLLCIGLEKTIKYLTKRFKTSNVRQWNWGRLTSRVLPHSLAEAVPVLHQFFSLGPISTGGNGETIFPIHIPPRILNPHAPWGPSLSGGSSGGQVTTSLRVIMDLGNLSSSAWLIPPGTSGWRSSSNYDNQLLGYQEGTLFPMNWEQHQIEKSAKTTLTLMP